jgi:hypothetical protein
MNGINAAVIAASIAIVTMGPADAFAKAGKGAVATSNNAQVTRVDAKPAKLHPSATVKKAINAALHKCGDCLQGSSD